MSAQEMLEHSFLAVEPEVVLVATDNTKKHLHLLVVFKGMEKLSVKFEFNAVSWTLLYIHRCLDYTWSLIVTLLLISQETDTADEVVSEMVSYFLFLLHRLCLLLLF